ncbi:PIN-like domain-containing protein [Cryobacterium sp. N21]|uniref:PIN-like domain-containing protein n=1 Tax=Cryobacterium sp. N21 TaxID=2048289 RepID=UPI001124D517|nr:PIN-like domain-containing protein [Cryobacterium sp. N21]
MPPNGLHTGLESFRIPTGKDSWAALQYGFLAEDTNVSRNLYRYHHETVDDRSLEFFAKVGPGLFVPDQLVREFWRNRSRVSGKASSDVRDSPGALSESESSTRDAIMRWSKSLALNAVNRVPMLSRFDAAFAEIRERLEMDTPTRIHTATPTDTDSVLKRLEVLLEGKVGDACDETSRPAATDGGIRKALAHEPPGHAHVDTIDSVNEEGVSGDVKDDWRQRDKGFLVDPRRELVAEYAARTSQRVFFLKPAEFLQRCEVLDVVVRATSVADIERVRDEPSLRTPWTPSTLLAVLDRLDDEELVDAAVIREAATNGGRVIRERVYEIDGRADERMLVAFARPVTLIVASLQAEGVVPEDVLPLLRSQYKLGVKARHFTVPDEVVDLLQIGREP